MTPFWIGLGIYLAGWVAFVVAVVAYEGGPFETDNISFFVPLGIMWPIWLVLGVIYLLARAVLLVLGKK